MARLKTAVLLSWPGPNLPALLAAALLLRRPLAKPDPAIETSDNPVLGIAPKIND